MNLVAGGNAPGHGGDEKLNDPGGVAESAHVLALRPFQGREVGGYDSGGVAPGYSITPFTGLKQST